jgi:hypothetical protein
MAKRVIVNRYVRRAAEIPLRAFAILTAPILKLMARAGIGSGDYLKRGVLPVPVHFYQPVFDPDSIPAAVWERRSQMPGVAFDPDAQLAFLDRLAEFAPECSWPEHATGRRGYHSQNSSFGFSSACLLHCVVRHLRPSQVIEVGAGMSTLLLEASLEANERDTGHRGRLVSIDPYQHAGVREAASMRKPTSMPEPPPDEHLLVAAEVQTVPLERFTSLQAGDLLFIDSSHVVRTGGDVNFLYLEVLPRLAPGVVIHIHDIQIPYEYHRDYSAASGAARLYWTEQYLLQAFLTLNTEFTVLLAGYWLQRDHTERFAALFPTWDPDAHRPTTSFYLQRCR